MHTENSHLCQIITTFSTGLTALNGLTAQVQNFATGTNGTDFNIESASTTHVFNLPTASGTNRGALSSTDWTTFNGKVGGTGASGQVAFWNGTSSQTGDNGLFWDNTNKRLGINTTTPARTLDIFQASATVSVTPTANTQTVGFITNAIDNSVRGGFTTNLATGEIRIGALGGAGYFPTLYANGVEGFRMFATTRNVLLQNGGTFTDAGFRLDVNGTARVQGVATITADSSVNNVAIGRGGGAVISNTRLGNGALSANTSGSTNTALGGDALGINTTGNSSTAVGYFALASNNANLNTAIGRNALSSNTTGGSNTAIGGNVMSSNITGSGNTAIGNNAGRYIADGTTGLTVSTNSIFLGASSRANADNETNQIVIGTSTTGLGSNTTVIGNPSTTFGRWFGNLLVGTSTNAGFALDVNGTARVGNLRLLNTSDTLEFANTLVRIRRVANRMAFDGFDGFEFVDSNASASRMRIFGTTGNVLIQNGGTFTDVASAILNVNSTTQGVLFPRMTTTQKNAIASPATGLVVYDTTLNKLAVYTGATWETITSV
jgi:hypothetical protein